MCQGWEVVVSCWLSGQPHLVWTLDCISRPRNLLSNDLLAWLGSTLSLADSADSTPQSKDICNQESNL
jgi:hypothetical protein